MQPFFVFDVESIGLHGEGFAVAGGIYFEDGSRQDEFCYSCPPENAGGFNSDREWVTNNVPALAPTHIYPRQVRNAFWKNWLEAKKNFPKIIMAGECLWPVEARFLLDCVSDDGEARNWEGPYPFHEIASSMFAAGMDPMDTYERIGEELPAHCPVGDARLSARLLFQALGKLKSRIHGNPKFFGTLWGSKSRLSTN